MAISYEWGIAVIGVLIVIGVIYFAIKRSANKPGEDHSEKVKAIDEIGEPIPSDGFIPPHPAGAAPMTQDVAPVSFAPNENNTAPELPLGEEIAEAPAAPTGDVPVEPIFPEPKKNEPAPIAPKEDAQGLPEADPFYQEVPRVNFKNSVSGSQLETYVREAYRSIPSGLLNVLALEESSNRWFKPDSIGMFSAIVFFVQLASTKASLTEVDFSNLIQVLQRMEMNTGGDAQFKETTEISKRVQVLKSLIQSFGVQITLHLSPREPVSIEKFQKTAAALRLKCISECQYQKLGDPIMPASEGTESHYRGAIEVYWVGPQNIKIALNVPLIAPEQGPLKLLLSSANALAGPLNAAVVEPSGRPLSSQTLGVLKDELDAFYARMRKADIEPGSRRAHGLLD